MCCRRWIPRHFATHEQSRESRVKVLGTGQAFILVSSLQSNKSLRYIQWAIHIAY
ncbi:hypothetical protein BDW59DRAFT_141163 [Aspergillus cavernicola]|uniref:Uncharacterized protein n=1 Tax=Aspergillus cavernicola TaxID=176166 RepID=A0ABR4ISM7_9EURO